MVRRVSLEDNAVSYFSFGEGEQPFVILPGLSLKSVMNSEDAIRAEYASFTDRFRVYVFDTPEILPGSLREMAKITGKAMDALGIVSACVFGNSMGGMLAQCLAVDRPELVRCLFLSVTACSMDNFAGERVRLWAELIGRGQTKEAIDTMLQDIYSPDTLAVCGDFLRSFYADPSEAERQRFCRTAELIVGFDLKNEISGIRCPALVCMSEGDRTVRPEASRELARLLKTAPLVYPARYGHAVCDEAPDFRRRLRDFFEKA